MVYIFVAFNRSPDFNTPESWFERTEFYTGSLFALAKHDTVINIQMINYAGECMHNDVKYHFVNFEDTRFPFKLIRFVKSLNPDIVFIQGLHTPLQFIQLGAQLNKKIKVIAQHHAEKPLTGLKRYLQIMADKYVDAYLFASRDMGLEWVEKGNISSAHKIHEVMEVSSIFSPMNRAAAVSKTGASGNPVFLWVGRLNDNKDPLTVIKAFLRFAEISPAARMYMIYHTEELLTDIQQLLSISSKKDAVTLIGKVPHGELQYWFNSADFILSGSHYEGAGTAVCEAMSCGCMPIITDIFSFRMMTDNGKCGLLYQPGNEEALFSALLQTQQMDIKEKQKNSIEHFKANLSFEAIANRIREIAESLT